MITPPLQILLLSLTMWGCSDQTIESGLDTMTTTETETETETLTTTTPPDKVSVLSFTTSEGEMVTEQVLTIELDRQTVVSVACTADVSFGDFEEKHTITAPSPDYTHQLRLNGLLAETTYSCATVSTAESATADFTTGSLPSSLNTLYNTPTGTPPAGYMLFNTFIGAGHKDPWLVIQDYWGNVRWYLSGSDGNGIIGLEYEPDAGGVVVGGGFSGNGGVLYPPSIYDLSGTLLERLDIQSDHDVDYRNGSLYSPVQTGNRSCIQRWSLDTLEQTWEWCASEEKGYNVNSIAVSEDESALLMTTYSPMEGIVKVDIDSGNKDWRLNPDGSGDLSVDTPINGLSLQHDVTVVECDKAEHDTCLLVYDNGLASRGYSQILNYGVNETKMTATLLRSFTRKGWYESHAGGVHEMPNGNWLITIASLTESGITSYLIVDVDGNELWELTSKTTDIGGYRARNIAPCDIFNHTGMCPE